MCACVRVCDCVSTLYIILKNQCQCYGSSDAYKIEDDGRSVPYFHVVMLRCRAVVDVDYRRPRLIKLQFRIYIGIARLLPLADEFSACGISSRAAYGRTSFSSDKVSTDHFSGPGTAIGLVCVCVCVCTWVWQCADNMRAITFEQNDPLT